MYTIANLDMFLSYFWPSGSLVEGNGDVGHWPVEYMYSYDLTNVTCILVVLDYYGYPTIQVIGGAYQGA